MFVCGKINWQMKSNKVKDFWVAGWIPGIKVEIIIVDD